MSFSEFSYGSGKYARSLVLREQVLRTPLGLELSTVDTCNDAKHRYFGVFAEFNFIERGIEHIKMQKEFKKWI